MRTNRIAGFLLALCAVPVLSQVKPETIGQEEMQAPGPHWVMAKSFFGPHYIVDVATGEMHGMLALTDYTPSVQPNLERGEIYAPESYYSRGHRGERTDVITVYDTQSLAVIDEIKVPNKLAALPFRQYVGLLDDQKHLAAFNMTPAQSVSIVNISSRKFVTEISTPGCALVMPSEDRGFMQLCGDGTIQLISLDKKGKETARARSQVIFNIEDDPIFDKPVPLGGGWLLLSFEGNVREASLQKGNIVVSKSWSLLSEEDKAENWKPGGGQLLAFHENLNLIFTLMHQGGVDTHEDPGSEVWVFNRASQRRIARIPLETATVNIFVSQKDEPLLTTAGDDRKLHVFDVRTNRLLRSIDSIAGEGLVQGF
jgi:methylamine dehydrogenase heavy chain